MFFKLTFFQAKINHKMPFAINGPAAHVNLLLVAPVIQFRDALVLSSVSQMMLWVVHIQYSLYGHL